MPLPNQSPDLDHLLIKEGHIISTRLGDGRKQYFEVVDVSPVTFLTSVKGITGSRLNPRDQTGASTSSIDTSQQSVLKQLRPDSGHLLQLLVGLDCEPHPAAQRMFFEAPLGTTIYDFDAGRADAKNIGAIDGRISSIEAPSGTFAVWLAHNLTWGLKFVNNYHLTADPVVWFLGALIVPDLIGIEVERGGPLTLDGKKGSQGVPRPPIARPVPIGRVDSNYANAGVF